MIFQVFSKQHIFPFKFIFYKYFIDILDKPKNKINLKQVEVKLIILNHLALDK